MVLGEKFLFAVFEMFDLGKSCAYEGVINLLSFSVNLL